MRLLLLFFALSACKRDPIDFETDPFDTDPGTDVDTEADTDTDPDTDPDTDTDSDTEAPLPAVPRAQATAGGAVHRTSPGFGLELTVGAPVHTHRLTSPSYQLTVGVVIPEETP